ncbi:MAG: exonuclease domain-containing protein [Bacteroidota bacterium]
MTAGDHLLHEVPFVVVDVETTGMSPADDRITEIALMMVRNGILEDEFSTLINPLVSIPPYITDITGIDNAMVRDAPPAREVVPRIADFLRDSVFVAHNAAFDWGFVSHTARRERNLTLTNPRLCTVKLSRRIIPTLPSKSLGAVTRFLDIPIPQRHRASGDAYATALVLVQFLSYLQKKFAFQTVGDVLKYQDISPSLVV